MKRSLKIPSLRRSPNRSSSSFKATRALALAVFATPSLALSASYDWRNEAGQTNWNAPSNWINATSGDMRNLLGQAVANPHLTAADSIAGIRFRQASGETPMANGYVISSDPDVALTLTSTQSSSSTALEIQGVNSLNAISANLILGMAAGERATFSVNTGATLTLSGKISSTHAIGGLTLANKGTIILSGDNTYAGTTLFNGGRTHVNHESALGAGDLIIRTGAIWANSSGRAITLIHENRLLLNHHLTFTSTAGTGDLSLGSGALVLGEGDIAPANRSLIVTEAGSTLTVGHLEAEASNYSLTVGSNTSAGKLVISNAAGTAMQGKVTLAGGVLEIGHHAALGAGTLEWQSHSGSPTGSTLQTSRAMTGEEAIANDLVLGSGSGGSTGSTVIGGDHALEFSGHFTNHGANRTLTINNAGTTVFSGTTFHLGEGTNGRQLTLNGSGEIVIRSAIANNATNVGNARLIYSGTGTLVLEGANQYTNASTANATSVHSGRLVVNGSLASGGLEVAAGATVGGRGSIGGAAVVAGTLSPGNSAGELTFQDLTLASGATYRFEGGDHTVVSGALQLNAPWTLSLAGPDFVEGGSTVLFTFGTLSGSFTLNPTLNLDDLGIVLSDPASLSLSIVENQLVLNGITGYAPIPEPSTVGLLFGGMLATLWLRRRRTTDCYK